ncbi:MAG: hypothetical protein JOZ15_05325 [Acidobacteria bacterium]|nr:hypothetical protein [Acidobacteriota bacterium]
MHRMQAAVADRVYVLADPSMNRQTASAALNCHRNRVEMFADRQTFPSREHLDKVLSRIPGKDLASDYAAAELRRAAERLQAITAKTNRVIAAQERPLHAALAAHSSLRSARLHVVEHRRSVHRMAARVYADPAKAVRVLLRDPEAAARLRRGDAGRYGSLRGRAILGVAGGEREKALQAAFSLSGRLDAFHRAVAGLEAAKREFRSQAEKLTIPGLQPRALAGPDLQPRAHGRAASPSHTSPAGHEAQAVRLPRLAQIRSELERVTAVLSAYREASRGPHDAIEAAIRGMSQATVDSALLLLPAKAAVPVKIAAWAVAHALERTLDLGLGR